MSGRYLEHILKYWERKGIKVDFSRIRKTLLAGTFVDYIGFSYYMSLLLTPSGITLLRLVYNPILTVPFILAPIVSASIGYWSVQLGLAGGDCPNTMANTYWYWYWSMLVQVVILVPLWLHLSGALAAFVIWYPFIKM